MHQVYDSGEPTQALAIAHLCRVAFMPYGYSLSPNEVGVLDNDFGAHSSIKSGACIFPCQRLTIAIADNRP